MAEILSAKFVDKDCDYCYQDSTTINNTWIDPSGYTISSVSVPGIDNKVDKADFDNLQRDYDNLRCDFEELKDIVKTLIKEYINSEGKNE